MLVILQLNTPRRGWLLERVVEVAETSMSIPKVGIDPILLALMIRIIGVGL
jgi:hypothetical protein